MKEEACICERNKYFGSLVNDLFCGYQVGELFLCCFVRIGVPFSPHFSAWWIHQHLLKAFFQMECLILFSSPAKVSLILQFVLFSLEPCLFMFFAAYMGKTAPGCS